MGKGGAKVEITEYFMAVHFGICVKADKLKRIIIKEKTAWSGAQSALGEISISQRELFGGSKKEGGVDGKAWFLPGDDTQILPDALAQRLGRSGGLDAPAYRGIASLWFVGGGLRNRSGFYWAANQPYLPGVWTEVERAPVGLDPARAMIFNGSRTPRAICFAIDCSNSMNIIDSGALSRLQVMKAALDSVIDTIGASADSGVQIDLGVVTFGSPSNTITRRSINAADAAAVNSFVQARTASAGDTDFRAGMNTAKTFFDGTGAAITERFLFFITDGEPTQGGVNPDTAAQIASGAAATLATLAGVQSYGINISLADTTYTAQIDNTAGDGVPVVSGSDSSGLIAAVNNALFADGGGDDANGAHIIYECLTNTDWGMGSPPSANNIASFEAAAVTLYAEAFGISMIWTRQSSIESFVQEVLDHIQAVLFVDPATGLMNLKLIRGDYDEATLPSISPDNAKLSGFGRKLWGEITNEIVVTWTNPENEQDETVTVQDLASIVTQGGIISDSRNYYGVRNAALAVRLAARDLRTTGAPLATCEASVDRTLWEIRPASVIKVTWPEYGLAGLVMRVMNVDYGKPGQPEIRLSLLEDVFGLDAGDYVEPPSTSIIDPSAAPAPLDFSRIFTLPRFLAVNSGADLAGAAYPELQAGVLGTTSSSDTFNYELWDEVALPDGTPVYESLATMTIIGRAQLPVALLPEASSVVASFGALTGQTSPSQGGFVLIGDGTEAGSEIALVTVIGASYTIARGVLDTVPRSWPAGTPVYFVDGSTSFEDPVIRSAGEAVSYKLLTRTSQGQLSIAAAPLVSYTLTERPYLPNRPANVIVNGEAFGPALDPVDATVRANPWLTVSWSIRNRLLEDSQVLLWNGAATAPEAGQTTKIRVLKSDGVTVLATHAALAGSSFDVPNASFGTESIVVIRVGSERTDADGTFESLQALDVFVLLAVGRATETGDARITEDGLRRAREDDGSVPVVPAATDPAFANVVLLVGANGADASTAFVDESPLAQAVTVFGAAQVDTADKKFGTGSLLCDVSGTDYVQVPDNEGFAFGSGNFTIELWWQPLATGSHYILGQGSAGGFAWNGIAVESNSLRFLHRDLGGAEVFETAGAFVPVINQWYHLAAERSGTIMRLYRDGVMVKNITVGSGALTNATDPYRIGQFWPGTGSKSRIDEVRITKGVARYNSDAGYTVPSAAFPRS